MDYEGFKQSVAAAAGKFKKECDGRPVRIISHLDADGIAAASIIINALNRENTTYSISIVPQLNSNLVSSLAKEDYEYFIFTDLASEYADEVAEKLSDRKILILDHHDVSKEKAEAVREKDNIMFVNPALSGIDGGKEIAGAGVVYLFAKALNESNKENAYLGILGAIGDVQEELGFRKLNDEILQEAIDNGQIEVKEGLRVFGSQTRPVHKVLEYSNDPYIPGVSGNESRALQFLQEIGINPRKGNDWKKLGDLTRDEMKRLVASVIMKRNGEEKPEDVLGFTYTLLNGERGTPFRDAKEFSTLLNACGRLNKASVGIGACLCDKKSRQRAMRTLDEYKKAIVKAMNWYRDNSEKIMKGDGYIIINAGENIPSTIIGTTASILTRGNSLEEGTLVMALANALDGTTKVSLRIANQRNAIKDIDLREIVKEITARAGGEFGGHQFAAGAVIPNENEEAFIEAAKEVLAKRAIEEKVS
ncbi:MAG: DHH family phosphoesterase [Candidatus Woesearchaeota archaeon]